MLAAAAVLLGTDANAVHQMTRVVKKNTPTLMTDNFSCNGGSVSVQVSSPPAHGRITTFTSRQAVNARKLKAASVGCEGKVVDILFVRYTPARSYVGPDSFSLEWSGRGSRTYSFEVK